MTNLFVYGTLMRKYRNPWSGKISPHNRSNLLKSYQPVLGKLDGYILVWPRELSYPFIIECPQGIVYGELYQGIPEEIIEQIDKVENVSSGLFIKKEVKVKLKEGKTVWAIAYVAGELLRRKSGWTGQSVLPEIPNWE